MTTRHALPPGEAARYWEDFYDGRDRWPSRPNALLVDEVGDLPPGTALDLGSGQGGDAIWLAARGWTVTAVDVAPSALARAAGLAETAGVAGRITWECRDLGAALPDGTFDLVSAAFLHSPVDIPREEILRAAADRVAPGGRLLVIGHASFASWQEPIEGVVLPTAAQLLVALDLPGEDWETVRAAEVEREVPSPDGEPGTRTDNVVHLRRR